MPTDLAPVRRALISVSDKAGVTAFAAGLAKHGVELVSTGGTARALREAGLTVRDVSELTGFPEMMDGRVKTLHPMVHGGLLALRDNPDHAAAMAEHDVPAIDLLAVNLYPFEATVASGADEPTCIENIDIGGPAMIRAAAKNHGHVAVVTDPFDYSTVLAEMDANDGATSLLTRRGLAQKAYAMTAAYDVAVSNWFAQRLGQNYPERLLTAAEKSVELRYGENPHQSAAFYRDPTDGRPGVAAAELIQGKELSYNNIADADAAFELAGELSGLGRPACAIIKHANPCGVALGGSLLDAYRRAHEGDPTSAFGGIVALNRPLDQETAEEIVKIFTEVVIAPGATDEAKAVFAAKANLRLMLTHDMPEPAAAGRLVKPVAGGFLVQDRDAGVTTASDLKVVTQRAPSTEEIADLLFAWKVAKHVKSNAIVYAKDQRSVGIGAGQMSRIDSTRVAAHKAQDMADAAGAVESFAKGAVVASDAFFPFPDGLIAAAEAGATAIIQPGGAMRDDEVIAAADERGLAMVFTGQRHFRH
ncbi:MAG: bifunctional phosphoribosylaminoimidazolecarboxamide formyltransferase/IMP cyclohydrolase [Pseudomonadota bacterium]